MPRKAFVADLQRARESPAALPPNVFDLQNGEDDGTFHFLHKPAGCLPAVTVQAHITDVSEYPSEHSCFVYTISDNVPPAVNRALTETSTFSQMTVADTIATVATILDLATAGQSSNNRISLDDESDVEMQDTRAEDLGQENGHADYDDEYDDEDEDEVLEYDDDIDVFGDGPKQWQPLTTGQNPPATKSCKGLDLALRDDLRQAKAAGFRISYLGRPFDNGQDSYLLVSCRIARLGIPEDALLAWGLDARDYIMLSIHYAMGYKTLDQVIPSTFNSGVTLHVGTAKRYKIGLTEAINAFSQLEETKKSKTRESTLQEEPGIVQHPHLRALFIGRPLDELLNNRLPLLVQHRLTFGLSWKGAEDFYRDHQGLNIKGNAAIDDKYYINNEPNMEHLPNIVTADHVGSQQKGLSFPLVAMQFMLRHLVRCTEFCLVCHCRIDANFEALKPYVCSNPLCLYQYMSLGFGPSIEYDIISQPYVVDLLISFCYSSAFSGTLKDFPLGMGLTVPEPSLIPASIIPRTAQQTFAAARRPVVTDTKKPIQHMAATDENGCETLTADWDEQSSELVFKSNAKSAQTRSLVNGDWIIFGNPKSGVWLHCRIVSFDNLKAKTGPPISLNGAGRNTSSHSELQNATSTSPHTVTVGGPTLDQGKLQPVDVIIYNRNFDTLTLAEQQSTICLLLSNLPNVRVMRDYLRQMSDKQMSLRHWTSRISPATLGVLRWILASNRSCIVQIDSLDPDAKRSEDRVAGMDGYMQFAQGAPDKEQRFIHSVQSTAQRLDLKYPTIFAWHGSPVDNWHGIVREGLHYKNVVHGRAYGNGVYHSLEASTSLGYSCSRQLVNNNTSLPSFWPSSLLRITSALSLNELVNAPQEYLSSTPHLVVQHVDWIQTRYLFVKCSVEHELFKRTSDIPTQVLEQDPLMRPKGSNYNTSSSGTGGRVNNSTTPVALIIPITAISPSRRPVTIGVRNGNKRSKVVAKGSPTKQETSESEESDAEDVQVLLSDKESPDQDEALAPSSTSNYTKKTDFVPDLLDWHTLPLIAPPTYATSQASKAIQRELKATLEVQKKVPAHELGWYLAADHVENVYQWIIELHSFDPSLPLHGDMKARGINSVVLELRFGANFPYSPPFVRVIRPRFLPFMQGGGGHVTLGGALCMELLTNSGWNPASSIEAVLLQVRMEMTSTDRPARLDTLGGDYGVGEAVDAYKRACMQHGWEISKDFARLAATS